eukprot:9467102-Pyramimonas_sp.AAC.1
MKRGLACAFSPDCPAVFAASEARSDGPVSAHGGLCNYPAARGPPMEAGSQDGVKEDGCSRQRS